MKQQINKKSKNTREDAEFPSVIDMDTLSCMSDDELVRLHANIQNEKDRMSRREDVVIAWEIEACYVQRELKIRSDRRNAHEVYLRSNPETSLDYYDNFSEEEDFDQSSN